MKALRLLHTFVSPFWIPLFGYTAVVFAVYHFAFECGILFWDDDVFILRNQILTMPFLKAVQTSFSMYFHGDYLPLTLLSYWLDVFLFGGGARTHHVVNLLYHSVNCLLVFLFIKKMSNEKIWAFCITLIFAIHPLQVEPVVWISERKSLLSGFFTLAALLMYLEFLSTKKMKWLIFVYLAYVFSVLSKTTAILLPLVFILLDSFYEKKQWQQSLLISAKRLSPLLVLVVITAVVRIISYDFSTPGVRSAMLSPERLLWVPLMSGNALFFYIKSFFWPLGLSGLYPFFGKTTTENIEGVLGLLSIGILLYWCVRQKSQAVWIYFSIFTLFMLPVLHIIPRANFVNDRYMYLPIIGFSGLVLEFVRSKFLHLELESFKKNITVGMILLSLPLAVLSMQQSRIWENNLTFWEHTVKNNYDNILARNALGLEYHERKRYEEAKKQFEFVLALELPTSIKLKSINNLANIYTDKNYPGMSYYKAIELYETAIKAAERQTMTYEIRVNLGQTYYVIGQKQRGRDMLLSLMEEVRNDPDSKNKWLLNYIPQALSNMPL